MKKIILLIVLIPQFVFSQNWIEKGTVWHYDQVLNGIGFHKLMYNEDTLINGHLCQKIIDSTYTFYQQPNGIVLYGGITAAPTHYTYNIGDSVFCLNDSTFYLLYDFSAQIGDSWVISSDTLGGCDTSFILVNDTGSMMVNNKVKKWIDITSNAGGKMLMQGRILEGIGNISGFSINNLFAYNVPCDTNVILCFEYNSFKCFSRNDRLLYNPSGLDCEYYLTHASIDNSFEERKVFVYPNPANDQVSFNFGVNNSIKINEIWIYNSLGQLIKKEKFANFQQDYKINISDYKSGIYYYKITLMNSLEKYSGKFVKL